MLTCCLTNVNFRVVGQFEILWLDRSSIFWHAKSMAKKVERRDTNTLAFDIVQQVTGQKPDDGKNKAAVALGRLGGLKGGKARAAKLTTEQRISIAKNGAKTRWGL